MATYFDLDPLRMHSDPSACVILNTNTGQLLSTSRIGAEVFDLHELGHSAEDAERILSGRKNAPVALEPLLRKLETSKGGDQSLTVGLSIESADCEDSISARLYREFEEWLLQRPEQWVRWADFGLAPPRVQCRP